jgi:hypothetical protein
MNFNKFLLSHVLCVGVLSMCSFKIYRKSALMPTWLKVMELLIWGCKHSVDIYHFLFSLNLLHASLMWHSSRYFRNKSNIHRTTCPIINQIKWCIIGLKYPAQYPAQYPGLYTYPAQYRSPSIMEDYTLQLPIYSPFFVYYSSRQHCVSVFIIFYFIICCCCCNKLFS